MKLKQHVFVGLSLIAFAMPPALAAPEWKKALQETLNAEYPPTKVGQQLLKIDYNRVTKPGTVYVIRIAGIYADSADTTQAILRTNIDEGHASVQKGLLAGLAYKGAARELKVNEQVYVLNVGLKDDGIVFELLTRDIDDDRINGSHRYRAMVFFRFDRSALPTMKFAEIKKAIDPVFATAEIASAVQSKTVRLGMSVADVKKLFGNPNKIVDLGAKQIYVYPDLKVVFKNGVVSDVQ